MSWPFFCGWVGFWVSCPAPSFNDHIVHIVATLLWTPWKYHTGVHWTFDRGHANRKKSWRPHLPKTWYYIVNIICYRFRLRKRSRLYFWSVLVCKICAWHNFVLGAMNKHQTYTIIFSLLAKTTRELPKIITVPPGRSPEGQ